MPSPFVEVKSALWQKILVTVIFVPCLFVAEVCWLDPWFHTFDGPPAPPLLDPILGAINFIAGFALWWPVVCYSIRADDNGISQTNGLYRQSASWDATARHYVAIHERFRRERRFHREPVLLGAEGKVIFQGFAHKFISTQNLLRQRKLPWHHVEAHLPGKKIKAPPAPPSTFSRLMRRRNRTRWPNRSATRQVLRLGQLVLLSFAWISVFFGPLYFIINNGIDAPTWLIVFLLASLIFGPMLVIAGWRLHLQRAIENEIEKRRIRKNRGSSTAGKKKTEVPRGPRLSSSNKTHASTASSHESAINW